MTTDTLRTREVITGVSEEEYFEQYAAFHYEWVKGQAIKMAPVHLRHVQLTNYLQQLLSAYLSLNPIGVVAGQPFVMRLQTLDISREPDLQVILNTNPGQLTDTAMIGPADICIEIISPESVTRDYGENFVEYGNAGVPEYWIIDPIRRESRFYRLQDTGLYASAYPDEQGHYQTPRLPYFVLHVPTLWEKTLPDFYAVGQAIQAMLKDVR